MQPEVYSLAWHRLLARARQNPGEEQVVVQALRQHRVDLARGVGDQEARPGVPSGLAERLDAALHTPVNVLDETATQRQHADDDEPDAAPEADAPPPPG